MLASKIQTPAPDIPSSAVKAYDEPGSKNEIDWVNMKDKFLTGLQLWGLGLQDELNLWSNTVATGKEEESKIDMAKIVKLALKVAGASALVQGTSEFVLPLLISYVKSHLTTKVSLADFHIKWDDKSPTRRKLALNRSIISKMIGWSILI